MDKWMDGVELMSCRLKAGGLSIGEVSVEDTERLVADVKLGCNLLLLWEKLGTVVEKGRGLCGLPDLAPPSRYKQLDALGVV
jgi:hypothetical protein